MITAEVLAAPGVVETGKDAEVNPAVTVTDPGTEATDFEELRVTTVPPDGALAESVTLPVEVLPP